MRAFALKQVLCASLAAFAALVLLAGCGGEAGFGEALISKGDEGGFGGVLHKGGVWGFGMVLRKPTGAQRYAITYHLSGGAFAQAAPDGYTEEELPLALPVPLRTGWVFLGWFEDERLLGEAVWEIPAGSAGDKTFWAAWQLGEYTITLHLRGGALPAGSGWSGPEGEAADYLYTRMYTVEDAVRLPQAQMPGHRFDGWYESAALAGEPVAEVPAGSAGDKSFWARYPYTVIFVTNSDESEAPAQTGLSPGDAVAEPEEPVKTGYRFGGWYQDGLLSEPWDFGEDTVSEEDVTLYAKWTAVTYTVLYEGNGADGGVTAASSHTYDAARNLTPNGFSRTGYTFAHWNASPGGTGASYEDGESVLNLCASSGETLTLYAQWTAVPYTVTLNMAGGALVSAWGWTAGTDADGEEVYTRTYTIESADIALPSASQTGCAFDGWFTDPGFGVASLAASPAVPAGSTGDKTFWAKWTALTYTVIWQNWDGTNMETDTGVPYGSAPQYDGAEPVKLPEDSAMLCAFKGWKDEAGAPLTSAARVTRDVVYTARFAESLPVAALSAGANHSLIVKVDGSVWAVGRNNYGQLGTGDTTDRLDWEKVSISVEVGKSGVAVGTISAGTEFSLVNQYGTVQAAGRNDHGQLGTGDTAKRMFFTPVIGDNDLPIDDATAVSAGGGHSLVLKADGSVWAAGLNDHGQLGLGDTTSRHKFTAVPTASISTAAAIAAGGSHSLVRKFGFLWTAGSNQYGQLGKGALEDKLSFESTSASAIQPLAMADYITAIAAGGEHSLILRSAPYEWVGTAGRNDHGQLGTDDTNDRHTWTRASSIGGVMDATYPDSDEAKLAAGSGHSLILKLDGTVWATGRNDHGQLGLGDSSDRLTWLKVPVASDTDTAKAISAGTDFSLILKADGTVWAAGRNDYGQLGTGDTDDRRAWTQVVP